MAYCEPVYIRRASLSDSTRLQVIEKSAAQLYRNTAYPELAGFDPVSTQVYARHFKRDHAIFIASFRRHPTRDEQETRSIAAGFALTAPLEDGLHLHELSVHADFQRQGLGSALLNQVIHHAKLHSYGFVSLTTYRDIGWNGPFYRKAGFVTVKPSEMNASLGQILNTEIHNGANSQTRCAMLLHQAKYDR